jgi:hypothetical protein
VLLAMALEQHYARRATPVEEWHELLFPPPFVDPNAEIWRRVGQRASDRPADAQVTPFLDVLAFGSIPQRQAAIGIIAQQFHPAFAPALKTALRDEHNVVRVQAATAIARLENEFLARTIELEAEADAAPDDDAAALALARHYDAQAFGGLMDPGREQECRTRAADGYARHLQRHPDDDRVRFELARLRQRSGLWSEAEAHLRPLVARQYPSARLWLMENLFAQRRFTELREVAAAPAPPDGDAVVPEAALAVALWAGEASAT